MNLIKTISQSARPVLYEPASAFMWTDPYISKQLLSIHLNPDVDLASRKKETIEKTADWILSLQQGKGKLNILDLGCGPGLYAERFATKGHLVSGVDISKNSIDYAKDSAQKNNLSINYLNTSYLQLEEETEKYDLIVLIYTDLGVLLPEERNRLLKWIFGALKKGGLFVFDVLSDTDLKSKTTSKNWEAADKGFWSGTPYLLLSESFLYEEPKVILYQHVLAEDSGNVETYRFWTHFFSQKDIGNMLVTAGFNSFLFNDNILPATDAWSGNNVIFTVATKQ